MHYFDIYGWLTTTVDPKRCTEVAPPPEVLVAPMKWLWTDFEWIARPYVDYSNVVSEPSVPQVKPYDWYIDVGPLFDRFGSAKMNVLTCADVGVQAMIKDIQIRKWIDLKLPEIQQSLAYIGSKVPAVTPALQTSILTNKVTDAENLALRKLYFS